MALRGFARSMEARVRLSVTAAKSGRSASDTAPNVPMPHIMYDFTPSAVAAKLRSETALPEM